MTTLAPYLCPSCYHGIPASWREKFWAGEANCGACGFCPEPAPVETPADPPAPLPALAYSGGTSSGWSGSDTSRERAEREDSDGTLQRRQIQVLGELRAAREHGRVVHEISEAFDWRHGQSSSALSNLHEAGLIARLAQRRRRCEIYVLPEFVAGRETKPFGRRNPVREALALWLAPDPEGLTAAHRDPAGFIAAMVEVSQPRSERA